MWTGFGTVDAPDPCGIGWEGPGVPAPPPSEPDVRISRIRLSRREFTSERIERPRRDLPSASASHVRQSGRLHAALHPIRGRQQRFRPGVRFHYRPLVDRVPGLLSPLGHSHRFVFRRPVLHASPFLPPFAPRPLRRFTATIGALTPQRLTRPLGSPRLLRVSVLTILSPTTWLVPV